MITVKATREGLVGQRTSSGYIVDRNVPYVALPSFKAMEMRMVVRIHNPLTNKVVLAIVLDVGPFNEHDDAYVFDGARPLSESGVSVSGKGTNRAGIDLGEYVWNALGMEDNTEVEWEQVKP